MQSEIYDHKEQRYRNRPIRFKLSKCWPITEQQYACTRYIRCSLDRRAHISTHHRFPEQQELQGKSDRQLQRPPAYPATSPGHNESGWLRADKDDDEEDKDTVEDLTAYHKQLLTQLKSSIGVSAAIEAGEGNLSLQVLMAAVNLAVGWPWGGKTN